MGVLKTKKGLFIKDRLSAYLSPRFNIFYVEQDPPGVLFEYPGILYALTAAIDFNIPVLYIHTKGAADPHHMWYQKPVKQLWEHEFGTDKVNETYRKVCTDVPTVICPIAGTGKQTWWNGMIINTAAAKIIKKTFHFDTNRFYYEFSMCNLPEIHVVSSAIKGTLNEDETNKKLREITKGLPDIDY
jgi:hypothetical protein